MSTMYREILPASSRPPGTLSASTPFGAQDSRRRRRKIRSCVTCRNRKLYCGQEAPACSRCVDAGQAANCRYIDEDINARTQHLVSAASQRQDVEPPQPIDDQPQRPSQQIASIEDLLSRLKLHDQRIEELELELRAIRQTPATQASQVAEAAAPSQLLVVRPGASTVDNGVEQTALIKGQSFHSRFYGLTHPESMIAYIPQLSALSKEIVGKFPALPKLRESLRAFNKSTGHTSSETGDLVHRLPPKPETDALVQLYIENYESIYHVVHIPSFEREYKDLWSKGPHRVRSEFVALVLLMAAAARCLKPEEPWLYNSSSSTAREKALATVRLCEDWFQEESFSLQGMTLMNLQVLFLINFVRGVHGAKSKRAWMAAGSLLRHCMAAGLHRDITKQTPSTLDVEMRRRLWYAVAEFELQAAFSRGMISEPWPQQSDCTPPSNIHDEDIGQDSAQMSSRSSKFTKTSYLALASETFMLRYNINSTLNGVKGVVSFDEAKHYVEQIEASLRRLPQWEIAPAESECPRALLSLNLQQCLLVLYNYCFQHSASDWERGFSKMMITTTALSIVDQHRALLQQECRALQYLCQDQLRTALSVCHVVVKTPISSLADRTMSHGDDTDSAIRVASEAVELMTDKVYCLGSKQQELWMVLTAKALMKITRDPQHKSTYIQEAADGMKRQYYKIIACQENAAHIAISSDPESAPGVDLRDHANEGTPLPMIPANIDNPADINFDSMDFDAMTAWAFDEWTFDPIDIS